MLRYEATSATAAVITIALVLFALINHVPALLLIATITGIVALTAGMRAHASRGEHESRDELTSHFIQYGQPAHYASSINWG